MHASKIQKYAPSPARYLANNKPPRWHNHRAKQVQRKWPHMIGRPGVRWTWLTSSRGYRSALNTRRLPSQTTAFNTAHSLVGVSGRVTFFSAPASSWKDKSRPAAAGGGGTVVAAPAGGGGSAAAPAGRPSPPAERPTPPQGAPPGQQQQAQGTGSGSGQALLPRRTTSSATVLPDLQPTQSPRSRLRRSKCCCF